MKKEILEEIFRIKEVMGIITEAIKWPWLSDIINVATKNSVPNYADRLK